MYVCMNVIWQCYMILITYKIAKRTCVAIDSAHH